MLDELATTRNSSPNHGSGEVVSCRIVRQLLKKHGFVSRQALKKKSFKQHPERNPQFQNITALKAKYLAAGQPVLSIDTKKKEMLGNFYRNGKLYTRETVAVLDHDFPSYSSGKIVPHGLYDIGLNKAHVNLGLSHDATEFACDSVARWWSLHGRRDHPHATQLLILCDGGGSNPSRSSLFRQDLQALANTLGLEIRLAHFPPYCSKHNPIEHRVFPHVTRACEGVVFHSVTLVKQLIERTHKVGQLMHASLYRPPQPFLKPGARLHLRRPADPLLREYAAEAAQCRAMWAVGKLPGRSHAQGGIFSRPGL